MNKARLLVIPVTVAFSLALASAASATTYCVHQPAGCVGTPAGSLNTAIGWADNNGPGTRDTIEIGPGTFPELPATIGVGNAVDIVGESAGTTILEAGGNVPYALSVLEPTSTISQLQVQIVGSVGTTGIRLAGTADHIALTSSGTQLGKDGIAFMGTTGVLSHSRVDLGYSATDTARGVVGDPGSAGTVEDSFIAATVGIEAADTVIDVNRSRIWGHEGVSSAPGGYVHLADSSVRVPGRHASNHNIYALATGGNGDAVIVGQRVTVSGDGSPNSLGVYMSPNDVAGNNDYVTLENSVLHNFDKDAWVWGGTQAVSTFTTKYSAYRFAEAHISIGGVHNSFGGDLDLTGLDPGFAGGSPSVPILRYDSPLVDAGDPGYQLPGTFDLYSKDRLRDGDGSGGARLDIGAFEYQRVAPTAKASAAPDTVDLGSPVSFTGTATDADRDDVLAYEWTFDDGGSASGSDVQHAFMSPGTHTGTLTVTDSTGLSTVATATATVNAPAPAPDNSAPAVPDASPPPVVERIAPQLTALRLSRTTFRARGSRSRTASRGVRVGTIARFATSEPVRVTLTVQRRKSGRWVSVGRLVRQCGVGRSSIRFDGRVHGRPLRAGRYRLRAVARDADGMTSTARVAPFRIAR